MVDKYLEVLLGWPKKKMWSYWKRVGTWRRWIKFQEHVQTIHWYNGLDTDNFEPREPFNLFTVKDFVGHNMEDRMGFAIPSIDKNKIQNDVKETTEKLVGVTID